MSLCIVCIQYENTLNCFVIITKQYGQEDNGMRIRGKEETDMHSKFNSRNMHTSQSQLWWTARSKSFGRNAGMFSTVKPERLPVSMTLCVSLEHNDASIVSLEQFCSGKLTFYIRSSRLLFLSLRLSVSISLCLSICLCPSVCLYACPSVSLSAPLYVCLSVCLFLSLFFYFYSFADFT